MFEIDKFNTIQDDNYYYVFRSLEAGDISDIESGITGILRTDRERYEGYAKYKSDSVISLEEMFDHIKIHYRHDTNCISFTTNAGVALLYGRDYENFLNDEFNDSYIVLRIPKNELGKVSFFAPSYMIDEIEKVINNYYESIDDEEKKKFDLIDEISDEEPLEQLLLSDSVEKIEEPFEYGIEFEQVLNSNFSALSSHQNFVKNKLLAKIKLLPFNIISGVDNKFLVQTLGSAFASMEVTHYGKIENNLYSCPQYIMDLFSILQQSNNPRIKEIEQIVINKLINNELDNLESFKYYNDNINNIDLSIENLYYLSDGKIDYNSTKKIYYKIYYYAKSKLRMYHSIKILKEIIGNDYDDVLSELLECYGIEPQIINKKTSKKIKLSDSVGIEYNSDNDLDLLNSLISNYSSIEDLEKIISKDTEFIKEIFKKINTSYTIVDKDTYYALSIIDAFDWKKFGITKISDKHRNDFVNKLKENNFLNIYYELVNKNYLINDISRILISNIVKSNKDIDIDAAFDIEELQEFLGYYKIKESEIKLRRYQADAYKRTNKALTKYRYTNVILPTGAGKSFVAITKMLEYLKKGKKVLYLAPDNDIINQIMEYLVEYVIGNQFGKSYEEIVRERFPNLTFSTYNYLIISNEKDKLINTKFSLIITDELHRTGAKEFRTALEKLYSNQDSSCKMIGITATPTRDCDGVDMADYWAKYFGYTDKEIMSGEHLAYNMDINEAIRLGYIINPKVINFYYNLLNSDGEIEEFNNMLEKAANQKERKACENAYRELLRKIHESDDISTILRENTTVGQNYMVFCPIYGNVDDDNNSIYGKQTLERYIQQFKEIYGEDNINCYSLLGSYSNELNRKNLESFTNGDPNKINFLFVLGKGTHGIHSKIHGTIMLRPLADNSFTLLSQMNGRVMYSVAPGQIISDENRPIIIDLVNNILRVNKKKPVIETTKTDDISRLKLIIDWINEYKRLPDINSMDNVESMIALTLKTLIHRYKGLIKEPESINKERKKAIVLKLIELSSDLPFDIWSIKYPARTKETRERMTIPYYCLTPIYRDFITLQTRLKANLDIDKLAEYIELLNINNYKIKSVDNNHRFSNGDLIGQYWHGHKKLVEEELESNPRYSSGYETAKGKIKSYLEYRKSLLAIDKLDEYIKMLNDDIITIRDKDFEHKFSNGDCISGFWWNNKIKIKLLLETDERYKVGFDNARRKVIENFEILETRKNMDKIKEYIELLNKGLISIRNVDPNNYFSNGDPIGIFFTIKYQKIVNRLNNDPYFDEEYDVAREKIDEYIRLHKTQIDKVAEYIELLNSGAATGKRNDKVNRFSNGALVNDYIRDHILEIYDRLNNDSKYKVGYEKAKSIIESLLRKPKKVTLTYDEKFKELLELLNQDDIQTSNLRKNCKFSNDDNVYSFWLKLVKKLKEILDKKEFISEYPVAYEKLLVWYKINREDIKISLEEKVSEFIELLNTGEIDKIIKGDRIHSFSDGIPVGAFPTLHIDLVKKELDTNPRYQNGYEIAKEKVNAFILKGKTRKTQTEIKEKINEYIELLNDESFEILDDDKIHTFNDGELVGSIWKYHKKKIINELDTNPKYKEGFDIAKRKINALFSSLTYEEKFDEYIKMLNDGTISQIKSRDMEHTFSDGSVINQFWTINNKKIIEALNSNPKYQEGFDTARRVVEEFKEKNIPRAKSRMTSLEDKIKEFIELINEESFEILSDDLTHKFMDGTFIRCFWSNNYKKIINELENNELYKVGYDVARFKAKIKVEHRESLIDKTGEYIEMLNNGTIEEVIGGDKIHKFSNGDLVDSFVYSSIERVKRRLEDNPKYEEGYELAKKKVKDYLDKVNAKKNIPKLSVEEKLREFILLLENGLITNLYSPSERFSNGETMLSFWSKHKYDLRDTILNDRKYATCERAKQIIIDGINTYEEGKKVVKLSVEEKLIEYVKLLNEGKIEIVGSADKDPNHVFSTGELISNFFKHYKERIRKYLLDNDDYPVAKSKVMSYFEVYDAKKKDYPPLSYEEKIEEFIEIINNGLNVFNSTFSNGEPVGSFWSNNKVKMLDRILNDSKYQTGYENALYRLKMQELKSDNCKKIKEICDANNIDYKINEKNLKNISYQLFEKLIKYFKSKNIELVDENGILISDFYMSGVEFKSKYGIGYNEILRLEKNKLM